MRKTIAGCVLGLLVWGQAGTAWPQGDSYIGMFKDHALSGCDANTAVYATTTIYFYAVLDPLAVPSLSAVQFKVDALPVGVGQGIVTQAWNTTLVIGQPGTDLALAFQPPLQAPYAYLGKIEFFPLNGAWIGTDHQMQIVAGDSQDDVLIVRGTDSAELAVPGGYFTFNCTGDCPCGVQSSALTVTGISPADGAAVEGSFDFRFSVESIIDGLPADFYGELRWDGVPFAQFTGYNTEDFEYSISTASLPHGSNHALRLHVANAVDSQVSYLDYTIGDTTPPVGELLSPPPAYQFSGGTLPLAATGEDFQGLPGMTAEFYREDVGSSGPTTDPILVVAADDGDFSGSYDLAGESAAEFDIGVVIVDAAGNRSPYVAHTVYFFPLNYRITIDVDHPSVHDWGAVAGVLLGATDGYDPLLDQPEPPTPPQGYVSCYFPHDDWDSPFGHRFNADVRAETDFMGLQKIWDFTVATDLLGQSFVMSFTADPAFVDSLPTYIVDVEAQEYFNLHEVTEFTFDSGPSGQRHFQLVIGPSEALPGVVAADALAGWNLLSLPLLPVDPGAGAIFGDDVGSNYFLYGYSETTGYLPASQLVMNAGYWLGLFAPATLDVAGSAQVDTLAAPLDAPWQLVGTGLYKNLALDRTRVRHDGQTLLFADAVQAGWISPAVYGWDPGLRAYQPADTLEIWRGYWVGQLTDGVEMLFHKDWGYIPIGGLAALPDPTVGWMVGFQASAANVTEQVYFGMNPAATRGFDVPYDYPKPPVAPGGGSVYMSFAHPEWRCVLGEHFGRDIRPLAAPGQPEVWTLRVLCYEAATLLTWPDWDPEVPADCQFIMDDLATPANEHIDLRETTSYALVGTGIHLLRVTVGSDLVTPSDGLTPVANTLVGAHPNPFNPATKLTFTLKEAARVRLDIFGIDGRLIATLADAPLAAGLHERIWDGSDARGQSLPSGIYFARLMIGREVFRTKLVLLK